MEEVARRPSRGELSYASVLQAREPVLVDLPDVLSKLWAIGARMRPQALQRLEDLMHILGLLNVGHGLQ